jgi:5-methylcytosine-specific restriction endonuclease McrA
MTITSPTSLSDRDLIDATLRAAGDERRAMVILLSLLGELDRRRLYLGEGCSSLFTYCTQVLRLSEFAAYERIGAARAVRQFPVILDSLAEGALTITAVSLLRPHLTGGNHMQLLAEARHKTKRQVEVLVARLAPRPDAPPLIRRMPTPAPAEPSPVSMSGEALVSPSAAASVGADDEARPVSAMSESGALATPGLEPPASLGPRTTAPPAAANDEGREINRPPSQRPTITPLAPERYLLKLTVSGETHAKLRQAQDLLRHSIPDGDPAAVIDRALTLLVDQLERRKLAKVRRPAQQRQSVAQRPENRKASRYVPAVIRRAVWARDQGRCAFEGPHGRCTETGQLEFHHLTPVAAGGLTTVANIALRCRAHNGYEGELAGLGWRPQRE